MSYDEIIKKSWNIFWSNKIIWIFAIFIGSFFESSSFIFNIPSFPNFNEDKAPSMDNIPKDIPNKDFDRFLKLFKSLPAWLEQNFYLIVSIIILLLIIGLVLFILKVISEAAVISAAGDSYFDRTPTFSASFKIGFHNFWRFIGLHLTISFAVFLILALVFAILSVPLILVLSLFKNDTPGIILLVLGIILFILFLIISMIPVSIMTTYAKRIIVIQKYPILKSIKEGIRLFKNNFGRSLLIWLIDAIISFLYGIPFIIIAILLLIPVGLLTTFSFLTYSFNIKSIILAMLIVIPTLLILKFLMGLKKIYISNLWTTSFIEFSGLAKNIEDESSSA